MAASVPTREQQVNALALEAKTDERKLEDLIRQNTRFILSCACRSVGHYVTESDDAWSVALIAFHEAVRSYAPEKGDFSGFAALVIRRRLLDHVNHEARSAAELSVGFSESVQERDGVADPLELEVQRRTGELAMQRSAEQTALRDEIAALEQDLERYGIRFPDLERCSPKARKTKAACGKVIRAVLAEESILRQIKRTKALPVSALREITQVPLNILDKHRKYIIAAIEILSGDYPYLAEYLRCIREGGEEA